MKTIKEKITVKRRGLTLRGVIVMLFLVVLVAAALTPLYRHETMKIRDKNTSTQYLSSLYVVDSGLEESIRHDMEVVNAEKTKEDWAKINKFLKHMRSKDELLDKALCKTTGLDAVTVEDANSFIAEKRTELEDYEGNIDAEDGKELAAEYKLMAGLIEFKDAKIEKAQQPELLSAGPGSEQDPQVKFATLETTDAEAIEASETESEPETLVVSVKRRAWEGFGVSKGFAVGLYTGFMAERTMIKVIVIAAVLIILFGWRRGRRTKKAFARISKSIKKLSTAGTAGRQVQPSSDRNPFEGIVDAAELTEMLKQIAAETKNINNLFCANRESDYYGRMSIRQILELVAEAINGKPCGSSECRDPNCSKGIKGLRKIFLEIMQQNRQLMDNKSSNVRDTGRIGGAEATLAAQETATQNRAEMEKIVKSTISAMLSPDEVNARIATAAMKGNLQALKGLEKLGHLTDKNVNFPVTDDGKTTLHIATRYFQFDVMKWLISLGAFNDVADNNGETACDMVLQCLAEACANDDTDILNGFWDEKLQWRSSTSEELVYVWEDCNIEVPDPEDDGNMIIFKCLAARCGAINILTWIKNDGQEDIDAIDSDGRTTTQLLMTYFAGQLSEGADEASSATDKIQECLNEGIIEDDDINMVFKPLAHDTDDEPDETTILITATRLGLTDAVSELIEMGADRDVEIVVGSEHKTALKILLECAGDVSTSRDTKSATLAEAYTKIRDILEVKQRDDDDTTTGEDE